MKRYEPARIPVLHTITRLIVGGAQENTLYTAERLNPRRWKAEVMCGPQTGSEGSLIEEARQRGIPLTIDPHLVRQVSPLNDFRSLAHQVRWYRSRGFTIVHTHSSKAGILGRLAARLAGTPVIVHTVHGWSFHDYMSPAVRRIYIALERWGARCSDAIIVVTERDIEKGLRAGIGRPEQYHHIRSAIPLEEFEPARVDRRRARQAAGLPEHAVVIGNVGRFSSQKNPLDWVRAAGVVGRAHPGVHFLLVGDGPLRPQVEAALIEEGIAERTHLPGLRRDVINWMAAMDIFLLSSLWEGLPRVLPQAMAMGLPVIANRADGTADIIQDGVNGYLCPPGNITAMADACMRLVDDPALRQAMGMHGQQVVRRDFDLDRMIEQIQGLYNRLLERKRTPRPVLARGQG